MQLFHVSACGLLETISLWLVFKDFSHSGRRYVSIFLQRPLRKDPKDAAMIRGWRMLFGIFSFIKCSQKTIIESGKMESLKATMTAMAMRTAEINSSEGLVPKRPISTNLRLQLCFYFCIYLPMHCSE